MAGLRKLGVALTLLALAGCGRVPAGPAGPADLVVQAEPVDGASATATVRLVDMGRVLELNMSGQGFATGGAYAVQPLKAYTAGPPSTYIRADEALPEALPVFGDGRVQLNTTFQEGRPWAGFGVFHHPDGNLNNLTGARLTLFVPMPAALR